MMDRFREAGAPSPFLDDTHDDSGLAAAIPFEPSAAIVTPHADADSLLDVELVEGAPDWLVAASRLIRPICVGALMAIPTLGAATVGAVALFNRSAAMAMVEASTSFLQGIPGDVVLLIGALASGYGLAKSVERLKGASA